MCTAHTYLFCLLVTAGLLAGPSVAQSRVVEPRDTVYTIGEITVTATRDRTPASRAPQRVTVISAEDIQSSAPQDLADVLEAHSGLFIRRYGQGIATASLRGSGASQTALLIDGLRLSDPQLGQFDLSLLPSYLIESVEVVHGPTSALYGTDGLGGAINLQRIRSEDGHLRFLTEVGAYGRRRMSGGASVGGERASGLVAAEYGSTNGDFPYLNEALFPARVVRRQNADQERRSLFGTGEFESGAHQFQAAVLYADAQHGIPGGAGAAAVGERQWDEHLRLWAEDEVALGRSRLDVRAYIHRGALRYVNPQLDLDETARVLTTGAESAIYVPTGLDGTLIVGMSGGYAAADHPSLAQEANEAHGAVFASATGRIGRALIYPAVRFDAYAPSNAEVESALSPRIGLNAKLIRTLPLFVKVNAGTAFRMPTFNNRFWQPGGNPDVRPEHTRSAELGVFLDHPRVTIEVTGFRSRTTDQIVWINESGDVWTPVNLSETTAEGLEATVRWAPFGLFSGGLLYGYSRAVDHSDPQARSYGSQLRYVPIHQLKVDLRAAAGPLYAAVYGRYVGRRFVTSDETESLPPAVILEAVAGAAQPIGPFRARLSVVIENALSARYALIQNYPMPPRHARLQLVLETR